MEHRRVPAEPRRLLAASARHRPLCKDSQPGWNQYGDSPKYPTNGGGYGGYGQGGYGQNSYGGQNPYGQNNGQNNGGYNWKP